MQINEWEKVGEDCGNVSPINALIYCQNDVSTLTRVSHCGLSTSTTSGAEMKLEEFGQILNPKFSMRWVRLVSIFGAFYW